MAQSHTGVIEIKELTEEHISQISHLQKSFVEEHYPYDKEYYLLASNSSEIFVDYVKNNMLNNQQKKIFVAEDTETEKIVGYISGWIEQKAPIYHNREYGYLSNIYVKETHRGQGIAKMLIDTLIYWFNQKNIKHVELTVDVRNPAAINAFEKQGFKEFLKRMKLTLDSKQ